MSLNRLIPKYNFNGWSSLSNRSDRTMNPVFIFLSDEMYLSI